MSRVGKMPVAVPQGVDVAIKEDQISVKGTGGTLLLAQNALVKVSNESGKLTFVPVDESREANAMSGTMRQLVNNMVQGVTKGFEKKLNLVGVGFRAAAQGNELNLAIGFSHPVNIEMPQGITVATPARRKSWSRALIASALARSPPRSAPCGRPSPTRARASATRTRRS